MDLSIIYSKTAKGLRARTSLIGGLPSQLMKALSHVDGMTKAEDILAKFGKITEQELAKALSQLADDGYIRTVNGLVLNDDWAPTEHFSPMLVEEFSSEEEAALEATKYLQVVADEAEMQRQAVQMQADLTAREKSEKIKARLKIKEKNKAMRKVKAKIEQEQAEQVLAESLIIKVQFEAEKKAQEIIAQEKLTHEELAHEKLTQEKRFQAKQFQEKFAQEKAAQLSADNAAQQKVLVAESARIALAIVIAGAERQRKDIEANAKQARQAAQKIQQEQIAVREKATLEAIEANKTEKLLAAEIDKKQSAEKIKVQRQLVENQQKLRDEKNSLALQKTIDLQKKIAIQSEQATKEALENLKKLALEQELSQKKLENKTQAQHEQKQKEQAQQAQTQQEQAKAARLRDHLNAQDMAAQAAKDITKKEMNRIAREAEQVKLEQEILQPLSTDNKTSIKYQFSKTGDWQAMDALLSSKNNPQQDATERAKLTANTKEAKLEIEKLSREDIKKLAANMVEAMEDIKSKRQTKRFYFKKWLAKVKKQGFKLGYQFSFIYVPLILLLACVGLPFINLSVLITPIEQLASNRFGQIVHINQLHVSVWPQPHLLLNQVQIGDMFTINSVRATPALLTMHQVQKTVKLLQVSGLTLHEQQLNLPFTWLNTSNQNSHLSIGRIDFDQVNLQIKDQIFAPIDGNIKFDATQAIQNIDINNAGKTLAMQIWPNENSDELFIKVHKWALPLNSKSVHNMHANSVNTNIENANIVNTGIIFEDLTATAKYRNNKLQLTNIEAAMFGGKLSGEATLDWLNNWHFNSHIRLKNANTKHLLQSFNSHANIDGKLTITAQLNGNTDRLESFSRAITSTASFVLYNGKINQIDLTQAVMQQDKQSLIGNPTPFNSVTGLLQYKNNQFQFNQLALKSAKFSANGHLTIDANAQLRGNLYADLTTPAKRMHTQFALAGTTQNVHQQQ